MIKPELNSVRYVLDERRLVYQSIDGYGAPEAATTRHDYDLNGSLSVVTNPRNFQTTYLQDGFGRGKRVTDALGHYTERVLDEEDNVTQVSRYEYSTGNLVTRLSTAYDEMGRPWESRRYFKTSGGVVNPDAVTTTWRDACGRPVQVRDPGNHVSMHFYDTAGRFWKSQDPLGNRREYVLDANGNATVSSSWDWNQVSSSFEVYYRTGVYDELDRVTQVGEADRLNPGRVLTSTFKHNSLSLEVHRTDPMGDTVSSFHDAQGNLVKTVYDLRTGGVVTGQITVEQGFDRNGRMVWQEDDNDHRTIYHVNARDEMTRIDYADATYKTIQRDLCGNPEVVTDQNGSVVTTNYNALDLPMNRSILRGTGVGGATYEDFDYDAALRCRSADNDYVNLDMAYDSLGNADFEAQHVFGFSPKSIQRTYDACSNQTRKDELGWIVDYTPDANDRRSAVQAGGLPVGNYLFAGPGLRTARVVLANGTQMNATFDGFGRESTRTWTGSLISSFTNEYNDRHERIRETWNHYGGFYTQVTLDSVGRTVASKFKTDPVSGIPVEDCAYDLDGVCNREIVTTNGTPVSYVANAINSYTDIGGQARVHDANGNLLDDGTQLYKYNYRNELIEVRRKSDGMLLRSNTNDALGRRAGSEFWDAPSGGSRSQLYVNDGWQVSSTYEMILGVETLFSRTVFGNGIDEPLMLEARDVNDVDGDTVTDEYLKYYYHRDTLGTITHVTNAYGDIVERYECTPFGKTTIYTGTGPDMTWNTMDDQVSPFSRVENNIIFQSRELDAESGLYYFRTRHYAPHDGRFIQRDTPGDWHDHSNIGNGYNFVICSPFNIIDPFGLRPPNPEEQHIIDFLETEKSRAFSEFQRGLNKGDPMAYMAGNKVGRIQGALDEYRERIRLAEVGSPTIIFDEIFDPDLWPTNLLNHYGYPGYIEPYTVVDDEYVEKWERSSENLAGSNSSGNDKAFDLALGLYNWRQLTGIRPALWRTPEGVPLNMKSRETLDQSILDYDKNIPKPK